MARSSSLMGKTKKSTAEEENPFESDSDSDGGNRKVVKKSVPSGGSSETKRDLLIVNKKFASKFEAEGRFKELQRNKELLKGSDDDGSGEESEFEDDEAEMIDTKMDLEIIKTINSIRKKDPKIYDKNATWYAATEGGSSSDSENDEENRKGKAKNTYKDVVRKQLLESGNAGKFTF